MTSRRPRTPGQRTPLSDPWTPPRVDPPLSPAPSDRAAQPRRLFRPRRGDLRRGRGGPPDRRTVRARCRPRGHRDGGGAPRPPHDGAGAGPTPLVGHEHLVVMDRRCRGGRRRRRPAARRRDRGDRERPHHGRASAGPTPKPGVPPARLTARARRLGRAGPRRTIAPPLGPVRLLPLVPPGAQLSLGVVLPHRSLVEPALEQEGVGGADVAARRDAEDRHDRVAVERRAQGG